MEEVKEEKEEEEEVPSPLSLSRLTASLSNIRDKKKRSLTAAAAEERIFLT